MKRTVIIILLIFMVIVLQGCAMTKWVCTGQCGLPYDQAANKCLAQANAAFSRSKGTIWAQCMRGEGYNEVPCSYKGEAGCAVQGMHVF